MGVQLGFCPALPFIISFEDDVRISTRVGAKGVFVVGVLGLGSSTKVYSGGFGLGFRVDVCFAQPFNIEHFCPSLRLYHVYLLHPVHPQIVTWDGEYPHDHVPTSP